MFVRWQTYVKIAYMRHANQARLRAILIEAVRIDGKPRQRHIAFLGSLEWPGETRKDGRPVGVRDGGRRRFWADATRKLDELGISGADRKKIGEAPARKIEGRLLTKRELAKWEEERRVFLAELSATFG